MVRSTSCQVSWAGTQGGEEGSGFAFRGSGSLEHQGSKEGPKDYRTRPGCCAERSRSRESRNLPFRPGESPLRRHRGQSISLPQTSEKMGPPTKTGGPMPPWQAHVVRCEWAGRMHKLQRGCTDAVASERESARDGPAGVTGSSEVEVSRAMARSSHCCLVGPTGAPVSPRFVRRSGPCQQPDFEMKIFDATALALRVFRSARWRARLHAAGGKIRLHGGAFWALRGRFRTQTQRCWTGPQANRWQARRGRVSTMRARTTISVALASRTTDAVG